MTKVLTVDPLQMNSSLIDEAAAVIKRGGLVAFPTETVYGLGANVYDERAVRKIFEVKKRSLSKPLAVCISDLEQLDELVSFISREAHVIIDHFLPGPLTLILVKSAQVPPIVTASGNSVGIRYPDDPIALALIRAAGTPIATTSANVSGMASPITAGEVRTQLSNKIDIIVDGGASKIGAVSTVIDLTSSCPKILREGALSKEEVLSHLHP